MYARIEMESAPRNVQVRPLSSSTMVITWEPPETPNGQVTVSYNNLLTVVVVHDAHVCAGGWVCKRSIKWIV